jgi:hypothetical protein
MIAIILCGCRGGVPKHVAPVGAGSVDAVDAVGTIAAEYVRLALALGERDPDSIDFSLAPQATVDAVHAEYPAYGEIARRAGVLEGRLGALPLAAGESDERTRAQFLALQLRAIETRVGMLRGQNPGFDNEAQLLFATTRLADSEAEAGHRKTVRAEVLRLLPAGRQPDAERYGAYDRRFLVPGSRLEAVMRAALAACRARTLEYVAMPQGEGVELGFVHNRPWSAFSRYRGHAKSEITINLDFPVTVDDALELACHEGYPGHHVFNTLRDEALLQGRRWPEMQVQMTFTPQSYVSEAMAAYAPRMAFTTEERAKIERETLFPLAGFAAKDADAYVKISTLVRELSSAEPAIAEQYLDERLEFVRAGQELGREALMDHPEAQLLYLNEFRSYMLAYTDGPRRIAAILPSRGDAKSRWAAYRAIMTRLQSTLPQP